MDDSKAVLAMGGAKHKGKERSKIMELKKKFEGIKKQEQFSKISHSAFLTPESATYLNDLIK